MDVTIQKSLNDRLYDKRKTGALELEALVRESLAANDHDRIQKIVHQLCHEYAYAVQHPHARNGGLIGLAAASIALGSEVARYLDEIVPPVLACFTDQDARVRYYACESMYNIAKVAKGEVLVYFNDVFDALSKLAADSELSVKNGAELLDRLVKDIVSESAATYVSVLKAPEGTAGEDESGFDDKQHIPPADLPTAFSLSRFIPLLQERINVINPYTRTFLVSWITLLDSIPDLELVSYLPSFLTGLFKFLSDPNPDVHTATQTALERFLAEIKKIARIKRGLTSSRKSLGDDGTRPSSSASKSYKSSQGPSSVSGDNNSVHSDGHEVIEDDKDSSIAETASVTVNDGSDGDWIPGQDAQVEHAKILDILVSFLGDSTEEEIQVTALRWIDTFFEICPEDILPFVPRLLSQVLPQMANDVEDVRQAAHRVNTSLMDYIMSLSDESHTEQNITQAQPSPAVPGFSKESGDRRDSSFSAKARVSTRDSLADARSIENRTAADIGTPPAAVDVPVTQKQGGDLDYEAAVGALTLQFLNEHEATRVAALAWLIMLHRKAPRKILAINDGTFPALLKTLSDPSDAVVTRDLLLLSQISKNSDESYFTSFMVNLLKLFCTDRRLLEIRGNLIIRQLCVSLSAERIYRTMADCLEKDDDVEFASIMVQNLNNNLLTAPELADLRKRLRNLETRDGQTLFVTLFKSWCHNAVATFSLCLLAQVYEQAYHLLQIFGELEMTVNMLIQIDKLVQLLESPVFTYLRLQLLEPEKFPHLYKCLYGLLMLLPQSSAFAALKNRLNSVSAIGYLHIAPRVYVSPSSSVSRYQARQKSLEGIPTSSQPATTAPSFERPNRLKAREEGGIRWIELLDKFKFVQEKARRAQRQASYGDDMPSRPQSSLEKERLPGPEVPPKPITLSHPPGNPQKAPAQPQAPAHTKAKSSLSLGRFASGVGGRRAKRQ